MNFLKKLFGVQDAPTDPKQEEEKNFEMFKYDGVRALQQHQFEYAAKCFTTPLSSTPTTSSAATTFRGPVSPRATCRRLTGNWR